MRLPAFSWLALASIGFLAERSWAAEESPRPNILLVIADDMGWKDVGYHGSEIATPNLDRLAGDAVQLDQFYACPTCSPTRASLLVGKYPGRVGILTPLGVNDRRTIPKDVATLPGVLRRAGYETALMGKWHLGPRPEVGPRQYGFDHTYGMLHGAVDKYTHRDNNGTLTWHRDDQPLVEEGHADDLITAEAIRYLQARGEKSRPFFLEVAFGHVHLPLQEEEKWIAPYRGKVPSESRRLYDASVSHLDDNVGRLMAVVREQNLEARTVVIFFSDNGGIRAPYHWRGSTPAWYGGKFVGMPLDKIGDNDPLRSGKGEVYEGGVRVPALVRWPGHLPPRTVRQPIGVVDLFPTLAGLAGAAAPPGLDGVDAWGWISGAKPPVDRTLFWQTPAASAFRDGNWKLVVHQAKAELFDLTTDPTESRDRAPQEPDRVGAMREKMKPFLISVALEKEEL